MRDKPVDKKKPDRACDELRGYPSNGRFIDACRVWGSTGLGGAGPSPKGSGVGDVPHPGASLFPDICGVSRRRAIAAAEQDANDYRETAVRG